MTQREINRAIRLTGISYTGYFVHHDVPGETFDCEVPNVSIGNAIVRALRERATPPKPERYFDGLRWRTVRNRKA